MGEDRRPAGPRVALQQYRNITPPLRNHSATANEYLLRDIMGALAHRAALRAILAALAMLAGLGLRPHGALAEVKYPEKPIRIIVPFAPGGAADILGRMLAEGLTEAFGQTVVIENRPGAGSNVGASVVARSDPDGYTLLLASSAIIASPALYRSLSYDISRDL